MIKWLENAVFYEIYPQTFYDSNADGIGDINGIIEKLDYLKETGFNAIWMNPCYLSPFFDAGYDVEDYYQVAPRYGTNEDLKNLFKEAHKRGIHILLDLVPGHTAMTCEWFQQSLKPEHNEYSGRYIWTNDYHESCAGYGSIRGSANGFSDRNGCFASNYYTTQPALNYGFAKITRDWQSAVDSKDALATRQAILDIVRFWLLVGCDGFRVDLAYSLVKDDEGHKETIKLWQDLLGKVRKEFPNAAFVSEWGVPSESLKAGFDMDFLLPFGDSYYDDLFRVETPYFAKNGKGDIARFFGKFMDNMNKTDGKGLMCISSGNHDIPRISNTLTDDEIIIAYAFIMSMPGAPFVYYGDEIGMRYIKGLKSVEGGYERTGSRTPMQWDSSLNCGFSAAYSTKLYTPVDTSATRPTVEAQISDEKSILCELKKLIAVRQATPELQASPKFELLYAKESSYPLVYKRGEKIIVAINPSDKEAKCEINEDLGAVIYNKNGVATKVGKTLTVPPCSASFFEVK